MKRSDRLLLAAIALSFVLHLAAVLGTPPFGGPRLDESRPPEALQVELPPPPAPPRAAATPEPPVRAPVRRASAPPQPRPLPQPITTTGWLDAPSPDGDPPVLAAAAPAQSDGIASGSTAGPASADEPAAPEYPYRRARLVFDLYYGRYPTKVGQVVHTWAQDGASYTAESIAEAVGFVSLFFGDRFVQRSTGQLAEDGLVPERYVLQRGSGRGPEVAQFDWAERKLALAWKTEHRLLDLPAGTQDPLSVLHQIFFLQSAGRAARVDLATSRKLYTHVYTHVGDDALETPLGLLRTVHFRGLDADGAQLDVWLDSDRGLLPVRLHLVDKRGTVLDQVIREARLDAAE